MIGTENEGGHREDGDNIGEFSPEPRGEGAGGAGSASARAMMEASTEVWNYGDVGTALPTQPNAYLGSGGGGR
jgi:hypothetical protein